MERKHTKTNENMIFSVFSTNSRKQKSFFYAVLSLKLLVFMKWVKST